MYRYFFEVFMFSFLPFLLTLTGAVSLFSYRTTLFVPKKLLSPLVTEKKSERRKTQKTLLLALSGTLGVGNITGVATSLILGGAGSVFWMLLSGIFATALKYAEATLSARYGKGGGMAGVLRKLFKGKGGAILSAIYAVTFLFLAFILGGAMQGNAILENASLHIPLPRESLALVLLFLLAFAVFGHIKRILRILSFTLPLSALVYIGMCFLVLFSYRALLPSLFVNIVKSAFDGIRPTIAGVFGTMTKACVKEGFLAGLLSNEAGAGTSALAHEENASTASSGAIGVLEVIVDTTFLCTISALTFLVSGATTNATNAGEVLYRTFSGPFGEGYIYPLLFSVIFLATSSNLCYLVYARRMLSYLGRERWIFPFTLLFLLSTTLGGMTDSTVLTKLSHSVLCLLSILTCIAILTYIFKEKTAYAKRIHRFIFVKLFKNGKNC